jgi:hypothetical protein
MPGFWPGGRMAWHGALHQELQQRLAEVKEKRRTAGSMAELEACDAEVQELKREFADRIKAAKWCLF